MTDKPNLYIGLLSGTSMDSIDAAIIDFSSKQPQLIASLATPIPSELKAELMDLCLPGNNEIERMGVADIKLGKVFANATLTLLKQADIEDAIINSIGSHGQTIRHRSPQSQNIGFTLQIGDPNTIAELTGITTIADFRRRDMAAGGEGAPLVPAFHQYLFQNDHHQRVIVNIGGMANITLLPGKSSSSQNIIGFDTGPGNVLMDTWIQEQQGKPYDNHGEWATSGTVQTTLLEALLDDPFLSLPPPKSTGREAYNAQWLAQQLKAFSFNSADIQATLAEFTAHSISLAIKQYAVDGSDVLICGSGAYNPYLLSRIKDNLLGYSVKTTDDVGLPAQWIEAMAFAWLAKQRLEHKPGNIPSVTGANHPRVLGCIYPGK